MGFQRGERTHSHADEMTESWKQAEVPQHSASVWSASGLGRQQLGWLVVARPLLPRPGFWGLSSVLSVIFFKMVLRLQFCRVEEFLEIDVIFKRS